MVYDKLIDPKLSKNIDRSYFYEVFLEYFSKNNNINQIDNSNLIIALSKLKNLLRYYPLIYTKIINDIVKKYELVKGDINKILDGYVYINNVMKKNSYFYDEKGKYVDYSNDKSKIINLEWFDFYCQKYNYVPNKNEEKKLSVLNHKSSIKRFFDKYDMKQETFEKFFENPDFYNMIIKKEINIKKFLNKSGLIISTLCYHYCIEIIKTIIHSKNNYYVKTGLDDEDIKKIKSYLDIFVDLKYKFTPVNIINFYINIMPYIKITQMDKEYLKSIGMTITYDVIMGCGGISYIPTAEKYGVLDFDKNVSDDVFIKIMTTDFTNSLQLLDAYKIQPQWTEKLLNFASESDQYTLYCRCLQNNKNLTRTKKHFSDFCINQNVIAVKDFLEKKFIPTKQNIFDLCYNYPNYENLKKILEMFINFVPLTEDVLNMLYIAGFKGNNSNNILKIIKKENYEKYLEIYYRSNCAVFGDILMSKPWAIIEKYIDDNKIIPTKYDLMGLIYNKYYITFCDIIYEKYSFKPPLGVLINSQKIALIRKLYPEVFKIDDTQYKTTDLDFTDKETQDISTEETEKIVYSCSESEEEKEEKEVKPKKVKLTKKKSIKKIKKDEKFVEFE